MMQSENDGTGSLCNSVTLKKKSSLSMVLNMIFNHSDDDLFFIAIRNNIHARFYEVHKFLQSSPYRIKWSTLINF